MHVLQLIAVEAPDADGAVAAAGEFLDPYHDEVFDYYDIGGRWDGLFDGASTWCAAEDLPRFLDHVDTAVAGRHAAMRDLRRWLVGPDGTGEVHAPFRSEPDAGVRARIDAAHVESAALFTEAMSVPCPEDPRFEMLGYRMLNLGRLMAGYYTFESRYFDAVYGSPSPAHVRERVVDDPASQWLVVVDLHN